MLPTLSPSLPYNLLFLLSRVYPHQDLKGLVVNAPCRARLPVAYTLGLGFYS